MSEQRAHANVLAFGLTALMVLGALGVFSAPAAAEITPEWVMETPLPTNRIFSVVVADDAGLVYVCGGTVDSIWEAPLDSAFTYNPVTGAVNWLPSMPYGVRGGTGALGLDGKVYVFTGFNDSAGVEVPYTQIYDPSTESWSLGADIPTAMWGAKAQRGYDGRFYVFGGSDFSGTPLNYVQIFDPDADSWSSGTPMPIGVYHGVAIAWQEVIFYIGGMDSTYAISDDVYYYVPSGDYWNSYSTVPIARWGAAGCQGLDGNLYYFGGNNGATFADGVVLDVSSGMWTDLPLMNEATFYFSGVAVPDGRVIAVGGAGTTTAGRVESLNVEDRAAVLSSDTVVQGGSVMLALSADFAYREPYGFYVEYYVMGPDGVIYVYDYMDAYVWAPVAIEISIPETAPVGVYSVVLVDYYMYSSWGGWPVFSDLELTLTVTDGYTLEERLAMLEDNMTALADTIQAQLDDQALEIADLETMVDSLNTALISLETQVTAIDGDLTALAADVTALSGTVAALQDALDDLADTVDADNEAMAADIADLQTQLTNLQTALTNLQTSVDDGMSDVQTSVDDKMSLVMGYAIIGLLVVVIVLLALMFVMGRKSSPPPPSA